MTSDSETLYTDKSFHEDVSHQIISSYFLGPQAENLQFFKDNIAIILEEQQNARLNYFPQDGEFISETVQTSKAFRKSTKKVSNAVRKAAQLLGRHSLPFWSPRYAAHMCTDMSMPALLGYFMTMLYNPNNASIETSPLTTVAEMEAGQQLCGLFGYNTDRNNKDLPVGWGHITCGGTVANLESIWVARNLKFYPLSLRVAIGKNAPLSFIADSFKVETCSPGSMKLLKDLSTWELLNLKVPTVLEIPDRLYNEYSISSKFLEDVMRKYTIQSTGKETLEHQFKIDKPIQYMLATTRHYSWPKGAGKFPPITGIGSDNVLGVAVDHGARVDLTDLEKHLQASLDGKQAVYAVVATIGSTEEGCVDPLRHILALRDKFQAQGLSFVVHADAAWGGYFASMLPRNFHPGDIVKLPTERGHSQSFVPDASLRAETREDIYALRYADTITVDPHKAGYIPYPGGGLCYRDERMRYLVTWTSSYISPEGTTTSIGIYGVEGSKPGASAMSTFFSNACIGLNPEGYGALLAEVTFTCSRLSAEWAAMSTKETSFVVVPFNMLPSELKEGCTAEDVEEERQKIRDRILLKSNAEMMDEDAERPEEDKAMKLLRALGSDLNINAFACNFRLSDGKLNEDIEEANYLNKRIFERLSVDEPGADPTSIPFYLTSTKFPQSDYRDCATNFKKRLGLAPSHVDLFVLRNVVMSPFPTECKFISKLARVFQKVVEEEVEVCRKRNEIGVDKHVFLVHGTKKLYLLHFPVFHSANHRRQLIVSAKIPSEAMQKYVDAKNAHPDETFILLTHQREDLSALLSNKEPFEAVLRTKNSPFAIKHVKVTFEEVLQHHPLNSRYRDNSYPPGHMPFYLYGTKEEKHIDHILVKSPNIQLSAEKVKFELDKELSSERLSKGCILYANGIQEAAMQPFLPTRDLLKSNSFFFRPGQRFPVTIFENETDVEATGPGLADVGQAQAIAEGTMTLGGNLYVDSEDLNKDPFKKPGKFALWKAEFDKIGKELD